MSYLAALRCSSADIGIMFGDSDTHVQRYAALLRGAAGTPSVASPV